MKKTNYSKSLLLLAFMLLGALVANAQDFKVGGIYYKIHPRGNTVSVTSGPDKYSGNVRIPGTVYYDGTNYSVTAIGAEAFADCEELTGILIPYSVTSIEFFAFKNCTGLTSINIPYSVTNIWNTVFWGCTGLTIISVSDGNAKYDSREGCNAVIETASNTLIAGCKNTVIPNSVTSIGEEAFADCTSLTSITIPNSVTSVGVGAFDGCYGLTSVIIPNSVTSIGVGAFVSCSGLTSITIPNSVTSIGSGAFEGCSGLTTVTVPKSVVVAEDAFDENTKVIRK